MNDSPAAQKVMILDTMRRVFRNHLSDEVAAVVIKTIDDLAEREIEQWITDKGKTPYAVGVVFLPGREFWIYHEFGPEVTVGFDMKGNRLNEDDLKAMTRKPILTLYYANVKNILMDIAKTAFGLDS